MNQNLLLILAAAVDIWAALFITQIHRSKSSWEVSLATSETNGPTAISPRDPIQIWLKKDTTMGFWPPTGPSLSIDQACRRIDASQQRSGEMPDEIRLVCDPTLKFDQWGPVAVRLSALAREVRLAPLKTLDD